MRGRSHQSGEYFSALAVFVGSDYTAQTEAGLMKMEGNRVRLRKEGLSLQVLSAYPGHFHLTFTLALQNTGCDSRVPR